MSLRVIAIGFSLLTGGFLLYLLSTLMMESMPALLTGDLFRQGYWDYRRHEFHGLAMIFGTIVVSAIALLIASSIGIAAAICTSELLSGKLRALVKISLELLAGIPSVIYGLLGVVFLLPWISRPIMSWGGFSGDTLLTAGCLLGLMVLPTVITFADDALRCVPANIREEGLGLGLSRAQLVLFVVLPQAKAGLTGALMLALGRAMGETIAVYMVVGRSDQMFQWHELSWQALLQSGQTLTTKLGGSELSIAYGDPVHWSAMLAVGLTLLLVVGTLAYLSERFTGTRP